MADIYDQHKAAFSNVSAYVITKDGERVATIAFKFPRDGAGRLYTYVHWLGTEMARGFAGGYGYDKRSAALADVARKLYKRPDYEENTRNHAVMSLSNFIYALNKDGGKSWEDNLRDAGFTVLGSGLMLELELEIEAIDALIKLIDAQPAPLPWHLIDARECMKEALDNEIERRADAFFSYGGERAEND